MNGLQIKLQLDDNQPARWFDVETINFDDEVCFADGAGEHIEIEYQGEPIRIKPPSLSDDQQVVLDYLKNIYSDVYEDCTPLETMYLFGGRRAWSEESNLTDKEEFQVLAAFAEWGMSND